MPDQPESLNWISEELGQLARAGLRRSPLARGGAQAATIEVDGRRLVNFSSNDYLGLAADPRLLEAAANAMRTTGFGSGASPLITGRSAWRVRLEEQIARFEDAEAALVFPTGFAANAGVIPALVQEGDAVFSDAKNHASLIDGCRLASADRFVYPHNDAAALDRLLSENPDYRRRLIVTDSLFSMDGDLAPLDRLAEIAKDHGAMLMVDEAHATGVWGARGRGLVEHFAARSPGVEQAVTIRVGTLSKALGCMGGFVAGGRELIEWLANRARSYVFSTAGPAVLDAAALAALEIIENEPHRREELLQRADLLRRRLREEGWNTGESQSQIVPIVIGGPAETMRLAAGLREAGLLVPGIRPPSVPEGESLLRVSLCWGHSEEDLEKLVAALRALR